MVSGVQAPPAAARRPRFFLGWSVVAVAALASFAEVAFFNPVLGVFIPEFEREFGWSRTEISFGVTLGSLAGAAFSPLFGPLIDRHGGRLFVAGGCALLAIGLVCMSLMQTEWQFFAVYALGRGAASGIIGLAASVTVSKWFVRRRGFAVGLTTLGSRAGIAFLPIAAQLIIDARGWRDAVLAMAGMVALLGVLPPLRWLHSRPERFGLLPDGDVAPPARSAGAPAPALREVSWTRHDAVRTRAFWLVTLAVSIQNCANGAINLHQIPHLIDRGLDPQAAALTITVMAVFSATGALFEGILDAAIGARGTLIAGLLGSAAGLVVLINVEGEAMALAYAALFGTAFGLMMTSSQIVFAEYFGREALGAIRGTAAPVQMGLNAVGPLVAGAAFDLTGSYLLAFALFAFGYLLAAGALAFARRPQLPGYSAYVPD